MTHNPLLVSAGIIVILCLIPMSQPRAQDQAGIAARTSSHSRRLNVLKLNIQKKRRSIRLVGLCSLR